MRIVETLAKDLIRAVVVNGRDESCCKIVTAGNLRVVSEVTHTPDDGYVDPRVETEAYLSVTVTDVDGHNSEVVWAVSLGEALTWIARDVTVAL